MDTCKEYYFPVCNDSIHRINQHSNSTDRGAWSGSFKIMAWLYSAVNVTGEFTLELNYEDERGEHTIIIDQCETENSSHILLTGQKSIIVTGILSLAKLRVLIKSESQTKFNLLEYGFLANRIRENKNSRQKIL